MALDVLKLCSEEGTHIMSPLVSMRILFFVAKIIEQHSHIMKMEAVGSSDTLGPVFQSIVPHSA